MNIRQKKNKIENKSKVEAKGFLHVDLIGLSLTFLSVFFSSATVVSLCSADSLELTLQMFHQIKDLQVSFRGWLAIEPVYWLVFVLVFVFVFINIT